ncbi:MAG: hypothetical protein LC115_12025 [Bacteroidia bacterium]|nr:hypothetical protein [Bacteroidia bacterium]
MPQNSWILADPFSDWLPQKLADIGISLWDFSSKSPAFIEEKLTDAEGLILSSKIKLSASLLEKSKSLRYIIRGGSGLENIDVSAAKKQNIRVISLPQGNRDAVAEHAAGMLLMLLNNLQRSDSEVRNFLWNREQNRGSELWNKTVGIIGFGNTGSAFANRLTGFGCRIIAYDKYKTGIDNPWVEQVSLETLQQHTDILSFHVPLTSETYHLGNNSFWDKFAKKIWVINLSRGAVIDTAALLQNLKANKIAGAALDVLEDEPLTNLTEQKQTLYQQLFTQNVVLSPHIGGWSFESKERISKLIIAEVAQLYAKLL